MKTIGLIGGMSWESSIEYYRILNETVKARLDGFHSAKCVMFSVDFAEIEPLQHGGKWDEAARALIAVAKGLEAGGAEFVVLCTNTMHKVADEIERHISIPLLHIADATARAIKARGLKKVGLLGTNFTMEQDFCKGRIVQKHGIGVLIPGRDDRQIVHRVIYDELCLGEVSESSREQYVRIIEDLARQGAEAVVLGCTEIGLLVRDEDSRLPLFDTTKIHATAAVEYALQK